jgi:hypothetical protein
MPAGVVLTVVPLNAEPKKNPAKKSVYRGSYPNNIKSVAGIGVGLVSVITNDGSRYEIHARETSGAMPQPGEPIDKWLKAARTTKRRAFNMAAKNPDVHIDINSHNAKGSRQVKTNPEPGNVRDLRHGVFYSNTRDAKKKGIFAAFLMKSDAVEYAGKMVAAQEKLPTGSKLFWFVGDL